MKPLTKFKSQVLTLVLTIVALMVGQSAWAANTWTVKYVTSSGKFKISRSGDTSISETVQYRTVSLSALAGQHFTAKTGTLTFGPDQTEKEVSVTETASDNVAEQYHFQRDTYRTYRFEVLDTDGFYLAHCVRSITYGSTYQHVNTYVNKSITDLAFFSYGKLLSGSGNNYLDVAHSGTSGTYKTIDDGYDYNDNSLCTVSTASLYNSSSALRTYLTRSYNDYKMYATVYFTMKEKEDGYQYIQILTDNSSTYDGKDGDGKISNGPSTSIYKAAFILTKSEDHCENDHYQAFPHRYDYKNRTEEKQNDSHTEFEYLDSYLYQQAFKSSSYRADNSGSLILDPTVNDINVRFDANGSGGDTWYVKNLNVRLALVDGTAPTKLSDPILLAGSYKRGSDFYISVPFSEIVTISGSTKKLTTSWGDATYLEGSGSNVLTFKGTIDVDAGTTLAITDKSGTIADYAGNSFSGSLNKTFNGITSSDPDYAITYNLDGGTLAYDQTNPTTYKWTWSNITLKKPIRAGYTFAGWTGSNGNTPQTTVTIPAGSHGDKTFTANWTPLWGQDDGKTGEDEDHAYVISSTAGLDMLAKVVNGTDGYTANTFEGKYFKLGNDITYTHNTDWNDANSTENNFTTIGRFYVNQYFKFMGTFDGDGNTVSGIRIYKNGQTDNCKLQGLFGYIDQPGIVRNITLDDSRITGYTWSGGIAGINSGTVDNCHVTNQVLIHTLSTGNMHGGIAGQNLALLQNSTSEAILSANSVIAKQYGGIAGYNYKGTIQNCLAVGASISSQNEYVGAIVGVNDGGTLVANYYRNCTVGSTANAINVGVGGKSNSADRSGARSVHTLNLPADVTASGESVDIDNVTYYAVNTALNLSYTGAAPAAGYKMEIYVNGVLATDNGDGTFTATMPAADATVTTAQVADLATYWQASSEHDGTTAEKAYIINDYIGLNLLAEMVNSGTSCTGKFFKLDADINMQDVTNFTPIGRDESHPFKGHFDGQYHIIRNIKIKVTGENTPAGLFGMIDNDGTVCHVVLAYATILGESTNYTGIIVGRNNGTITESYYYNCGRNNSSNVSNWGTGSGDGTGTHSLHPIKTNDPDITLSGTSVDIDNATYYASNTTVNVGYAGVIPDGYKYYYSFHPTNINSTDNSFTMLADNSVKVSITKEPDFATWWHADEDHDGTTEERAYLISSTTGLKLLSYLVNHKNTYDGKYFKQDADIAFDPNDLDANGENFTAIGCSQHNFKSHFDGQGHTISGIRINKNGEDANANNDQGLFGIIYNATVKNVILSDAVITGYRTVGGLVGDVSFAGNTIENCLVLNSQINITSNNTDGGAICGYNSGSTLTNNRYYNCTVTNADKSATTDMGVCWADRDGAYCVHLLTLDKRLDVAPEANVTYKSNIYYPANTAVTLSAEGYTLNGSYTVKDAQNNDISLTNGDTFTMPASDVTVSADLSVIPVTGSGSKDDPYIILYSSQMNQLGTKDIKNGEYYKLGRDITYRYARLGETESNHTPIHVYEGGYFDGNGHTISGIRVYNKEYRTGVFGSNHGTVKNLTVTDAIYTAGHVAGGIVGTLQDNGIIENCHVTNTVIINSIGEYKYHGGIAGDLEAGWVDDDIIEIPVVRDCTSAATVTNNGFSDCDSFGGIVGSNINGIISGCKAIGATIICNDGNGGIAGHCHYEHKADGKPLIENCIVIDCTLTGEENMGAISGNHKGDLKYNYYYNSTVNDCTTNVGCDDEDVNDEENPDGAVHTNGIPLLDTYSNDYIIHKYYAKHNYPFTLAGRTFVTDGMTWNTICLPFNIYYSDLRNTKNYFHGAEIMELDQDHTEFDYMNGTLVISFKKASDIQAARPYLIRMKKYGDETTGYPTFYDTAIGTLELHPVTGGGLTFEGQFNPFVISDGRLDEDGNPTPDNINEIIMMGKNNTFGFSKNPRTLRPFRCHFFLPIYYGSQVRGFELNFDDGEVTSINDKEMVVKFKVSDWYTLDGRKLDSEPTAKGVYINNGKKVNIK